MKIFLFCVFGFLAVVKSCGDEEPCAKRAHKELIQITHSPGIDSISVDPSFSFKKSKIPDGFFYTTGWQHIESDILRVAVYVNSDQVNLEFAVKNDQFLYIILGEAGEHVCDNTSSGTWESLKVGNIEACYYYEIVNCP